MKMKANDRFKEATLRVLYAEDVCDGDLSTCRLTFTKMCTKYACGTFLLRNWTRFGFNVFWLFLIQRSEEFSVTENEAAFMAVYYLLESERSEECIGYVGLYRALKETYNDGK